MLQMRARVAFRDAFADAFSGLYIAEEAQDMRDVTPHETIHNPLQDDAEAIPAYRHDMAHMADFVKTDEVPPKQLREEPTFEAGPDECDTGVALTKAIDATIAEDDSVAGQREAADGGEAQGAASPPPPEQPPAAKPPRQARRKAQDTPEPAPVSASPPDEKASPAPNPALGIAFGKPREWITRTGEEYQAYLRQWTEAWEAWGQDPDGLRDRYAAERTIRNALSAPMDESMLQACKAIATEAFKKLGGVLR